MYCSWRCVWCFIQLCYQVTASVGAELKTNLRVLEHLCYESCYCYSVTLSIRKPTWIGLASQPVLRDETPAVNCMSHVTAVSPTALENSWLFCQSSRSSDSDQNPGHSEHKESILDVVPRCLICLTAPPLFTGECQGSISHGLHRFLTSRQVCLYCKVLFVVVNSGTWSSIKPMVPESKEIQFSETEAVGSENQRKHSLQEFEQNWVSKNESNLSF